MIINWISKPYPHAIIDNFLPIDAFNSLCDELDKQSLSVQKNFETPVEKKTIYLDSEMGNEARNIVRVMGGSVMKEIFSNDVSHKMSFIV